MKTLNTRLDKLPRGQRIAVVREDGEPVDTAALRREAEAAGDDLLIIRVVRTVSTLHEPGGGGD